MTKPLIREAAIIQSINFDQHQILLDIMQLYCPQGFELDPCYGAGGFYRHAGIPRPRYCFDLEPRRPECEQADCRQLPLPDGSVSSAIFDPPWLIHSQTNDSRSCMKRKYGSLGLPADVLELYVEGMRELSRVLRPGGVLVVKCQDMTHGRQNYWLHVDVYAQGELLGLRAEDLFVRLTKSRPVPWNMETQQHARKMHSYFWVFKKRCR